MILYKMTRVQLSIIQHLAKRGHAMDSRSIAHELGMRYISVLTIENLFDREYIRSTDQGWLITDAGRLRAAGV